MLLQNLTKLPEEIGELDSETWHMYNEAVDILKEYIPDSVKGRCRHIAGDNMSYLFKLMHKMDAINCIDNNAYATARYLNNHGASLRSLVRGEVVSENSIGICINEEASTHFIESDYPGITRMTALENMLKQTPSHFLRIFTAPTNQLLYVWTNKTLTPNTIYHLKAIQNSLDVKYLKNPKEYVTEFYKAILDNDIEKVKETVNVFMNSDYVKNFAMTKFKECMSYNITLRISRYENDLNSLRESINTYEEEIMRMINQIREKNEAIEMLKGKDQEADINTLYKYLSKHPYIVDFRPTDHGVLNLHYVAPLIYFNEYALDKMIKNREGTEKFILQTIKDRKYTLWTECALNFESTNFKTTIPDFLPTMGYFPHPHIVRYRCFGNHNKAIQDSAVSGDYLGAIEQMSQAVLNINFYDTCVANEMLRNLRNSFADTKTWVEEATGELISLTEIMRKEGFK